MTWGSDWILHNPKTFWKAINIQETYAQVLNIRKSFSGIIHNILGAAVWWKLYIQPAVESDFTDGKISHIYKSVKKIKAIWRYMEALEIHNGSPTVYLQE